MTNERVTSLYICCWSLRDPLCQSQTLAYLTALTERGHRFALITFDQERYALAGRARKEAREALRAKGIHWYPLPYRSEGVSALRGRAIDSASGVALGTYVALRHRARVIHTRASVPAPMGMAIAAICRLPFLYDADGELSREYVDAGHWAPDGASFKLTRAFEALARGRSDATIVLTNHYRDAFLAEDHKAAITVVPCCVDAARFRFDQAARDRFRAELGLGDETLYTYVGKVGRSSWYLVDETFAFFCAARAREPRARLLVLSPNSPEDFHEIGDQHGIPRDAYEVRSARPDEVPAWLSAADVGLAFIAPMESKRGCSPIKVGEYLATGLPVAITDRIGDYSALIRERSLGVVVGEHTPEAHARALDALSALMADRDQLRARCRRAAVENVSLEVGVERYDQVYRTLLSRERSTSRQ